jgi:hypothetical protein
MHENDWEKDLASQDLDAFFCVSLNKDTLDAGLESLALK